MPISWSLASTMTHKPQPSSLSPTHKWVLSNPLSLSLKPSKPLILSCGLCLSSAMSGPIPLEKPFHFTTI
uniref:Uncharacterized protein n=1 Tax=Rhizophora mucronata TaxID=61149 RepID=A0A2P2MYZ3_RHIMU